jgi:hypothetical protein
MPPKKGKVAQVPAASDPPEGACVFVRFLSGKVCCILSGQACVFLRNFVRFLLGQVCVFVRCLFRNFVRFLSGQMCCILTATLVRADEDKDAKIAKLMEELEKLKVKPPKVKKVRVSKYKAIHATTVKSVLPVLKMVKDFNKFELHFLAQEITNLRRSSVDDGNASDVSNYTRWVSKKRAEGKLSLEIGEMVESEEEEDEEEESEEDGDD